MTKSTIRVEQVRESVHRGVEFLNEKIPDWKSKIDIDSLNMENGETCILGQIFKEAMNTLLWTNYYTSYNYGLSVLNIDEGDKYGFADFEDFEEEEDSENISSEDFFREEREYTTEYYGELTKEWVKVLRE